MYLVPLMFCQLYGGPKISKLGQVTWATPT